jgi:CheY-like chemotaxis protein
MASLFPSEQLERLRDGSRRLAYQASTNEHAMQSLLTAAESDLHHAEDAFADAAIALGSAAPASHALAGQVSRHRTGVDRLRRLCLQAREHQLGADRFVSELGATGNLAPTGPVRHAVLVVDDHQDSRDSLALALQGAGFLVRTASNGLEAVLAAYEIQPAVIVMDVMMPILDGVEATRLIKAIDELRDACVIAYTATPPDVAPLAPTLFSAVLRKPSSAEALIATVQRYAAGQAGQVE